MKHAQLYVLVFLLLLLFSASACSPGGAQDKLNCSSKGEICITINSAKSFPAGNAYPLKITVTSQKDITGLNVSLRGNNGIDIDGPNTWEKNLTDANKYNPGMADWTFDIKAGQIVTFNRILHFPNAEGEYNITAFVRTLDIRKLEGYDTFEVFVVGDSGKAFRAGEPFPFPDFTPPSNTHYYGPGTPVPTECCTTNTPFPALPQIDPTPTIPVPQGPYPGVSPNP